MRLGVLRSNGTLPSRHGTGMSPDPPRPVVERRAEPRRRPDVRAPTIDVPGAVMLEVVDVSEHGLCCRLATPVAPGRSGTVRVTGPHGAARLAAQVVRCEVAALTSGRVEYHAAWRLAPGWFGAE